MKFSIEQHQVLLNGQPYAVLSGAIHYFRTLPEQWEDRLLKLRSCGFNTVETYLAWHLHEVREGEFDFSGRLDFARFIRLAGKLGLHVIVRPGPYICSECDLGGMPGWLLGKPGIRLRCCNSIFLAYVKKFFHEVMPMLAPLQCTQGGPVIAMQLENEYGSYADDKAYLRQLADFMRQDGIEVQLFTSDGAGEIWLKRGTLPEFPATVNYRCNPKTNMQALDRCDTGYPNAHVTMELWNGKAWHWGVQPLHHNDEAVAADIRAVLEDHASVNCYMFHGGTNFGFTSGANFFNGKYMPLLTSYEVDAILDEAGNPTPKYSAVQKVMEQYHPDSTAPVRPNPAQAYSSVKCTEYVSLANSLDRLSVPVHSPLPEPMEHFGQSFGFILYSAAVQPWHSGTYIFQNMRDRAIVMLNGTVIATVYRNDPDQSVTLNIREPDSRLDILVENMGRVNFGTTMESELRGMTGFCLAGGIMHLTGWTIRPLPLDDWSSLQFGKNFPAQEEPGFYRAEMLLNEEPADTFLYFPEGTRGYCMVNGFNIGRYWNIGPQRTLYIPAPLLKKGHNEIVVFELHGLRSETLHFSERRILDPMQEMPL